MILEEKRVTNISVWSKNGHEMIVLLAIDLRPEQQY